MDPMDTKSLRTRMVDTQIAARGVCDDLVLDAMRTVPRERFVEGRLAQFAYDDTPLPIEEGQTISQPYIVALMAEALDLNPDCRVLEIGAGSGYAAAVLGRIASEVYAIERHEVLARHAADRMRDLGYDNVRVRHGDGTLGWPEQAPFDAIAVAAGGPEVPRSLLQQLAIGGRLVIPIGSEPRSQQLVRVRRTGENTFEREFLGAVQFVPLIGAEGWTHDGMPLTPRRERRPLRIERPAADRLAHLVAEHAQPFDDVAGVDFGPLLERIGDARVVLIGEATHGTSEFYRMRAAITRALIERAGFTAVCIEGDWPDTSTFDRYVRGRRPITLSQGAFTRFPTWMWRNRETQWFVEWLAEQNRERPPEQQTSMHGLDVYGLSNAIGVVLDFLDRVDPQAAQVARVRYGCFSPWENDPATYGRVAIDNTLDRCEDEAVATLQDLLKKRLEYAVADPDDAMDAERAAYVVKNAERYYRVMYYGASDSWNLRDEHMFDTLEAVRGYRGENTKAVVWAHNSHVGNAAATEMGLRDEINIGHLARRRHGLGAYLIGFGTDHGTVAAASNWDEPMQRMRVRPSHPDSYERLFHDTGIPSFLLPLREPEELRGELLAPHLERAIGVVYRPETEILSHYFQAALPAQFDEYVWFDETRAVDPIPSAHRSGVPETYPFGV
jgi:protein-L-isoaspartate(D-aspartate) O-methyltransferase